VKKEQEERKERKKERRTGRRRKRRRVNEVRSFLQNDCNIYTINQPVM